MPSPNIILVICDDMQFEQLQRTPRIMHRVGLGGTFFANCYTAVPICQPARVVLMTGQYPHNNGVETNEQGVLGLDYNSMVPRRLQLAGYQTAHYGKFLNQWHATDPVPPGFDEFHAFEPQNYSDYNINNNGVVTTHVMDYYTEKLNAMIDDFLRHKAREPFFLWIGEKAPHFQTSSLTGISAPAYKGCVPLSKTFPRTPNWNVVLSGKPAYVQGLPPIDATLEAQIDSFWRTETEMLFSLDRSIEYIMETTAEAGFPNTYMFVLSDNGYMHGEHRIPSQKGFPYDPCMHVPLIVQVPFKPNAGYCTRLVSHVDVAATFYAISGATPVYPLDGASLAPYFSNDQAPPIHSAVLAEAKAVVLGGPPAPPPPPDYKALRTLTDLYVEYATGEKELYLDQTDPWQMTNVAGQSAYAAIQADRAAKLATLRTCAGGSCVV